MVAKNIKVNIFIFFEYFFNGSRFIIISVIKRIIYVGNICINNKKDKIQGIPNVIIVPKIIKTIFKSIVDTDMSFITK